MENKANDSNINFGNLDTAYVMQTAYGDPIPPKEKDVKSFGNILLYGIILPIILVIVGGWALLKRKKKDKNNKEEK